MVNEAHSSWKARITRRRNKIKIKTEEIFLGRFGVNRRKVEVHMGWNETNAFDVLRLCSTIYCRHHHMPPMKVTLRKPKLDYSSRCRSKLAFSAFWYSSSERRHNKQWRALVSQFHIRYGYHSSHWFVHTQCLGPSSSLHQIRADNTGIVGVVYSSLHCFRVWEIVFEIVSSILLLVAPHQWRRRQQIRENRPITNSRG